MDPFTLRMRERARLRKEMIAGSEGQEDPVRSPLKEQNKTHTVKITTEEVTYSKPQKETRNIISEVNENTPDVGRNDAGNDGGKRADVRDRLQRLGALYSGSASSPIQRTEQTFSSEPVHTKPAPARSARLAALADSINQWEDDLAHPSVPSAPVIPSTPSAPVAPSAPSAPVAPSTPSAPVAPSAPSAPVAPSTKADVSTTTTGPKAACSVIKVTPKKDAWDAGLMKSLESQGFSRSTSKARLEYDFQGKVSPTKTVSTKEAWLQSPNQPKSGAESWRNSPGQGKTSPTKPMGSPEKRAPVKGCNIVAKAAMFETGRVDPAELSLAERAALFERNAGAAPVPRVPFGTPLPKKLPRSPVKLAPRDNAATSPEKKAATGWTPQRAVNPVAPPVNTPPNASRIANPVVKPATNNMVGAMQALLAAGGKTAPLTTQNIAEESAAQRQQELSALRNRWGNRAQETGPPAPPPVPPPMPAPAPACPVQPSPVQATSSPGFVGRPDVGRIRVSPPKPGRLYPCLSDIDATETESSDTEDQRQSWSLDSSSDASFGRSILAAVSANAASASTVSATMDSSADGSAMDASFGRDVLAAVADCTDSDTEEGPTPPKKQRHEKQTSGSAVSHSFRYHHGNQETEEWQAQGQEAPLLHTVSFYRRQQPKLTPQKAPSRPVLEEPEARVVSADNEAKVEAKIQSLMEEVGVQLAVISQASRALSLCHSTIEFSASQEAIEAERLLLLAGQRRLAAMNEVQRLRVERSLKPLTEFGCQVEEGERGVVTLKDITLPLKRDFLRTMDSDPRTQHLLVLVKCQDQVLATQALPAGPNLVFKGPLRLVDLFSDFKVRLEVYTLQSRREVLSHDAKYHIASKKDKGRLTPKKRAESRLLMPPVESPGGPNAVRGTAFTMAGFVVFSLAELRRTSFTLNTVSPCSPLEGHVGVRVESQLSSAIVHRGFLTVFQDVTGFGAWHRRWCLLQGSALSFWKYPEDERTKVPLDCIELTACETKSAELVSRQVCARPNTFLLETNHSAFPNDGPSLVLINKGDRTVLRHLLSADTKEDRVEWCQQINKSLRMLRAWTNSAE